MSKPSQFYAVVHWYEEFRGSVLPIESVPADARYEGALTKVKWVDNVEYKAKIFKISSDTKAIDEAESKLSDLISKLQEESKMVTGKRNRKSTAPSGKASERQVSKAVGEKPKLTKEQEEAKKLARKLQREKEAKQKDAEKSNDLALIAKRSSSQRQNKSLEHLVLGKYGTPSSVGSEHFPSNVGNKNDIGSMPGNKNDNGSMPVPPRGGDSVIIRNHSDSDDMMTSDDDDVMFESHHQDSSAVLPEETAKVSSQDAEPSLVNTIYDLKNPNTERFLRTLTSIFSAKPSIGNSSSNLDVKEMGQQQSNSSDSPSNKKFATPIFKAGDAKVPLREGHALLISKSLKSKLVLKSKTSLKNPVRLLKRLLEYLYGKAQLKLMSAKGLRSFIGIPDPDLLAIYAFINKYAQESMDFDDMIKEITRKCVQIRGGIKDKDDSSDRSGPNTPTEEKGSKKLWSRKSKSPMKSPRGNPINSFEVSPMKPQALLKGSSQGFEVSPFKQQRISPNKRNVTSMSQFCIGPFAPQAQRVLDLADTHSQAGAGEVRRYLEFTVSDTSTPSASLPQTSSHTPYPTPTSTPSVSQITSHTPYPTPAPTPSLSQTSSHTPYPAPAPTPSLSQTSSHTPYLTPTSTPSGSQTSSHTPYPAPAPTPSLSQTSSHTPYPAPTSTPSVSQITSHTPYPTPAPTPSVSQTASHTPYPASAPTPSLPNPAISHPSTPDGYSSLPPASQNYDQQYFGHHTYPNYSNYPNYYDSSNSSYGNYSSSQNNFTH